MHNLSKTSEKDLWVAYRAAKLGGGKIIENFMQNTQITKKEQGESVTLVDIASEEAIIKFIHAKYPADLIYSEENNSSFNPDHRTWIVDPLDGTSNFILGIPHIAISIALWSRNQIDLGVVYNPFLKLYFYAYKGEGAFGNKNPLKVSFTSELSQATIALIVSYKEKIKPRAIHTSTKLRATCFRLLDNWAPSLDWSMLAQGKIDALVSMGSGLYDMAAGILLVQESGGTITDFWGNPPNTYDSEFLLASNGQKKLHEKLLDLINCELITHT